VASDETWATLSKTYSTEQLLDAVFTVGQYNMVSWVLNSVGVPLDDFLPQAKASRHGRATRPGGAQCSPRPYTCGLNRRSSPTSNRCGR
jgi:hypothetical protein